VKRGWFADGVPGLLHVTVSWFFVPVIVVVTSAEVVARYVFHTPLQWAEEVITFSLLLVFVGSIPYGISREVHVKVETLYETFSTSTRALSDAVGAACGALFLGVLAIGAGIEALGMARRGEVSEMTGWVQWPLASAVCAIAAYCSAWLLLRAWGGLRAKVAT
jgi:TRAP-type C4-dicarboxylate transport system permease small subunit